jgi:putative phosphoesterase
MPPEARRPGRAAGGREPLVPRIGLLSDSHGRASTTEQAARLLVGEGADELIHLGDLGGIEVLDALLQPGDRGMLPVRIVFGNVDFDVGPMRRYADSLGIEVAHPVGSLPLEEGELRFTHGHETEHVDAAIRDGARYLCRGHTHEARDERVGSTRIVNPGALFRAARYTAAIIDTDADVVSFFPVAAVV